MDTLKTKGWGEEQSHGVRTTQFVPKQCEFPDLALSYYTELSPCAYKIDKWRTYERWYDLKTLLDPGC